MTFRKTPFQATALLFLLTLGTPPAIAADKTIANWTVASPADPSFKDVYTVAVRKGILILTDVNSSKLGGVDGQTDTYSVSLARVQSFDADTYPNSDGTSTYRIGIATKGDQDLLDTRVTRDEGKSTDRSNGKLGLALFGPDQRALRDDTFRKLCALIHQTPVIDGSN